jgi:hypothetical protein
MNKLQKLLATQEEIKAELEKERQAKIQAEHEASMEKSRKEARQNEMVMDGMFYGQAKEYADILISNYNLDLKVALAIGTTLSLMRVPEKDFRWRIESIKRHLETLEGGK